MEEKMKLRKYKYKVLGFPRRINRKRGRQSASEREKKRQRAQEKKQKKQREMRGEREG